MIFIEKSAKRLVGTEELKFLSFGTRFKGLLQVMSKNAFGVYKDDFWYFVMYSVGFS